jgi:serine protease Do
MKYALARWMPFVLAGMGGGLLVFAAMWLIPLKAAHQIPSPDYAIAVHQSTPRVASAPDLVQAAAIAMPTVVHIKSTESEEMARRRYQQERARNPWSIFEDEFFFGFPNRQPNIRRKEGSGSGVIYTSDGYIVTNNHVIEFADQVEVTLNDNRKFRAALVGADPKTDMAVLKIDAVGLPTLQIGDSDKAQVGEWVLAVGNPFDLNSTVTAGIISARGRNIDIIKSRDAIEAFIQTDAAVNPGNSGGALVDTYGRLLGINTAIATRTGYYSGYSFAIPVNMVRRIVEDIIETGFYQRAKMGLSVVELDNDLADELKVPFSQGLVVEYLEEGAAAELAGLQAFDVIVEANGKPVRSYPELQEQASQVRPGDTMHLKVFRNGRYIRIPIKMR